MARHRRRRGFSLNAWFGSPRGHRRAAMVRWGKRRRHKKHKSRKHHGHVGRPRRVGRPRKHHRKHRARRRHYRRHRGHIDRRTRSYRRSRKAQYKEAAGFLAMTAPGGKYKYRSGVGYVKRHHNRRRNPMRYGNRRRHYRRHRRNPGVTSVTSLGGYNWSKGIEPALVIGTSIMASQVAVGYLGSRGYMTFDSAWKRYGVQVGAGVAGVFALRAMKKNDWAQYWGLGSLVTIAADLLATYVLPSINSMLTPTAAVTPAATTAGFRGGMGAFPRDVRGVGAFPSQVQRMGSPYDRSGVYPY